MEWLTTIVEYYDQNKIAFFIAAITIFVLLLARFKSLFFRLFLLAMVLFGTYFWVTYLGAEVAEFKDLIIERHFPRERLK
jgi:hypothetical protein